MRETAGNRRLTGKQERALMALLSQPTIQAAAKAAEISERTLFGWLKEPLFAAAYRTARAEAVSQAIGRLQQASAVAVTVLVKVMEDTEAPASVKLTAAVKILEFATRGCEIAELERRVKELERAQDTPNEPEHTEEAAVVSEP